tara:strand:- start:3752 stop:4669 length:918 start_codon:yes stop_codon:yes gene_type:complete
MSLSSITQTINRLQKEIADLQQKLSLESKKESDCNIRIGQIERSINKHTSESTLRSKADEIDRKTKDISNIQSRKSDILRKISEKNSQLSTQSQQLEKEKERERKKKNADDERERKKINDLEKRQYQERLNREKKLQYEIQQTKKMAIEAETLPVEFQKTSNSEYDLFISHASEDKNDFVRPLVKALEVMGIKVWYDEFTLKVGDSLRKSIDHGLVRSKFGTVILSSAFCSKNWTQYELDSMVAKEMNGHKMILPIWHKISKDEVLNFSPALADKVALNTSINSIQEIAEKLADVILTHNEREND